MKPKVIFSGIDTHPANSLAIMFRSVGYEVFMLSDKAMDILEAKGYTGGVRWGLLNDLGYSRPNIPYTDDPRADIFVDLKLDDIETYKRIYPEAKLILYVINGGWDGYEHYGEHYPTITNNFWVKGNVFHKWSPLDNVNDCQPVIEGRVDSPIGLIHNARNWGFGGILDDVVKRTGLRLFGGYGSPMGLIPATRVKGYLSTAKAFVHLKASDCPGWALWEAFATATPVVATALLPKRMKMEELYKDGETCLLWGKTSFSVDPIDEKKITEYIDASRDKMIDEICEALERLKDPEYSRFIGMNGYQKWKELTEWTEDKRQKFAQFLQKNGLPAVI